MSYPDLKIPCDDRDTGGAGAGAGAAVCAFLCSTDGSGVANSFRNLCFNLEKRPPPVAERLLRLLGGS